MLIEIKNRFNNSVLFSNNADENTLKITLLMALKAGADLRGADLCCANLHGADLCCADLRFANLRDADLRCANLRGADLRGADLRGANLYGADLRGADLRCADLRCADLRCANLRGADLRGADLRGADLCNKKLIGKRPYFQVGPIGSRSDYFQSFITDQGIQLKAGCFSGSIDEFELALDSEHGSNNHAEEYKAALVLIKKHAELWMPEVAEEAEAA